MMTEYDYFLYAGVIAVVILLIWIAVNLLLSAKNDSGEESASKSASAFATRSSPQKLMKH